MIVGFLEIPSALSPLWGRTHTMKDSKTLLRKPSALCWRLWGKSEHTSGHKSTAHFWWRIRRMIAWGTLKRNLIGNRRFMSHLILQALLRLNWLNNFVRIDHWDEFIPDAVEGFGVKGSIANFTNDDRLVVILLNIFKVIWNTVNSWLNYFIIFIIIVDRLITFERLKIDLVVDLRDHFSQVKFIVARVVWVVLNKSKFAFDGCRDLLKKDAQWMFWSVAITSTIKLTIVSKTISLSHRKFMVSHFCFN